MQAFLGVHYIGVHTDVSQGWSCINSLAVSDYWSLSSKEWSQSGGSPHGTEGDKQPRLPVIRNWIRLKNNKIFGTPKESALKIGSSGSRIPVCQPWNLQSSYMLENGFWLSGLYTTPCLLHPEGECPEGLLWRESGLMSTPSYTDQISNSSCACLCIHSRALAPH